MNPEFDGSRLAMARALRGLLKSELAKKIDKSPAAVGQFEKGVSYPDNSTLASICLVLGVRRQFFHARQKEGDFLLDNSHFRSMRSSSSRERQHLLARGALTRDVIGRLSKAAKFPTVRVPQVQNGVHNLRDAESAARAFRKALELGDSPLGPFIPFMEGLGVIVIPINEGSQRVSAFSTWIGTRPYIFLNRHDSTPRSRTRFDSAHELGHLVMHADVEPGSRDLEQQADRFASALLLPREPFLDECPPRLNWTALATIKHRWGASLAAIVRRAFDLGRFSEATYRRAYVELNRRGWRYDEPFEDDLPVEAPGLLSKVLVAAESNGFSRKHIATELGFPARFIDAVIFGGDLDEPQPMEHA